mmetsp:Transcript_24039/g.33613  ORF Transcript_24039/g.33613 Transcript_24039/m.33613 type:complete len:290 (+) Transcript_24039:60-929(+)
MSVTAAREPFRPKRTSYRHFLYGGLASCCAEAATMPLDVIKVRMQVQGQKGTVAYKTFLETLGTVIRSDGVFALWTGTGPALLRQGTYGTLRVGLYARAKEYLGVLDGSTEANPVRKISAGIASGSFSAAVCNPTDLIKVRMQASRMESSGLPRYSGIIENASHIVQKNGFGGLYRGVGATASRAAVVAAAELGSYDEIKAMFRRQGLDDGISLHLKTGALAGLCATAASSPFDVVKSRMMSQPVNEAGRGIRYTSMIDCFRKCLASEGISFMWRGFSANYLNKGPTVV